MELRQRGQRRPQGAEWDLRRKPGAAVDNPSQGSTKPGDRMCGSVTALAPEHE